MPFSTAGKGARTFGASGSTSGLRVTKSSSCPCLLSKGSKGADPRSGTHTGSPPKASSGVGDLLKRACACLDEPRSVKMANKWEDIHAVASELLPSEAAYGLYRLGHMLNLMDAQKRAEMAASKVVETLLGRIAAGATDLSAPALAHTLDGCARLGQCDFLLHRNLALRVREVAPQLSAQQTVLVLAALGTLGHPLPAGVLADVNQAVARLAPDMTATDASKAWSAFRALKAKPSADATTALLLHVVGYTQSYTRSQLADCLEAWSALGMHVTDTLLDKLRKVATCPSQRPSSLTDAGSVGPNPANMPALTLNGLNPTPPPRLVVPGYNSNAVPAPRMRLPPRAKAQASKPAATPSHMDRTPSDDPPGANAAATISRAEPSPAQALERNLPVRSSAPPGGGAPPAKRTVTCARAGSAELLKAAVAQSCHVAVPELKLRAGAGDTKAARGMPLVLPDGQHPARISPRQIL